MSININGQELWDSRDMAKAAGVSRDRLGHLDKPDPDLIISRANYWKPETVERWVRSRGGRR